MDITTAITTYIASLPEQKRKDIQFLHEQILTMAPEIQLWFLDGKNAENKVVSNPNIGYGLHEIKYANGSTKNFYQVGISTNTTGISVYIMRFEDKGYLAKMYRDKIGKATITGYCIKCKSLKDIHWTTLKAAIADGLQIAI